MKVYFYTTSSGRNPVDGFIKKQDVKAQSKIFEIIEYLKQYGLQLPETYLKRMTSTKKLWELRIKYKRQYRIFLAKVEQSSIVLLHGFIKKTQKTPAKEIETAEDRLRNL